MVRLVDTSTGESYRPNRLTLTILPLEGVDVALAPGLFAAEYGRKPTSSSPIVHPNTCPCILMVQRKPSGCVADRRISMWLPGTSRPPSCVFEPNRDFSTRIDIRCRSQLAAHNFRSGPLAPLTTDQ